MSSDRQSEISADVNEAIVSASSGSGSSKTDSSMYYYFKSTPAEQAHQYKPQKIEVSRDETKSNNAGVSAWNQAGTW
jgi:hypothetical protein